jgi:sodium/potassium/calcium exchanger 6
MAVLWICWVCSYVVDCLNLLGVVLSLPNELLGMTLLAWGNSVGDFLANVSIARVGLSQTALTACYAGPLFNILIGLGVSLSLATLNGPVSFPLFSKPALLVSTSFLLLSLSLSMLFTTLRQGKMSQFVGKVQVGVYLGFTLTLAIVLA